MALTVTENSVRQINAALLSLEKKIGETNNEKAQDKQTVQMELKNVQYNFRAPLRQDGISVGLDTTGVWEGTARTATSAENALTAENATTAETAENATTATTAETANKVKNALTVNGKTYDGSSAVNAGVQTVANGGTGKTTANGAANSFINSLSIGGDAPVDNDYFISQYVNGGTTSTSYHRRPISKLWEYIKGKISSVLGLTSTNYGGKASTAGTADDAYTAGTARSADIKRTLDAVDGDELQIGDGAKVHIVNSVHARRTDSANITKTGDTVNGDKLQIGDGTAVNITNAKHAATSDKATKDGKGNNIVDTYATKTSVPKNTSELTNDSNFISEVIAKASVDANVGTPSVTVTGKGTSASPLSFVFKNIKGAKGDKADIKDWITLPENTAVPTTAKDVHVVVYAFDNMHEIVYPAMIPAESLDTKQVFVLGGYYYSSTDYGLCNVNVNNRKITLRNFIYGGTSFNNTARIKVRYR